MIDKYGNAQIDNEFYVNKNILRPTRRTRDNIEILSNLYREPAKRYSGEFRDENQFPSYNKSTKAQYLCLHYELGFNISYAHIPLSIFYRYNQKIDCACYLYLEWPEVIA